MARGNARLGDDAKALVVAQLAAFETPSQVAAMVKEEFGVEVSPQAVQAYDPTKRAGRNLSQRWRIEFEKAREAFRVDLDSIPIANKAVRLQRLQRMLDAAEKMRNLPLAAQLLEQAAREVGGSYSNRQKHEVTGKDGASVAVRTIRRVVIYPKLKAEG
jgi:hypothetical protein